jgi:hypothetical protein
LADLTARDHRKLVVVDGTIALVGGRNLSHEYYTSFEEVRPTVVSVTPGDANGNGSIDRVTVVFSEDVDGASLGVVNATGFTLTGYTLAFGLERLSLRVIEAKAPAMPAH